MVVCGVGLGCGKSQPAPQEEQRSLPIERRAQEDAAQGEAQRSLPIERRGEEDAAWTPDCVIVLPPEKERGPQPGGRSVASFDRSAAVAAFNGVDADGCARDEGPDGPGHVRVTFAPDGHVSDATFDAEYTPATTNYQGTTVGRCLAERYLRMRIPPFAGGPVTVGHSVLVHPRPDSGREPR